MMTKWNFGMVEQVHGLHYRSLGVVEVVVGPHHGSSEKKEASIEASLHGIPYLCKSVTSQFYKKD